MNYWKVSLTFLICGGMLGAVLMGCGEGKPAAPSAYSSTNADTRFKMVLIKTPGGFPDIWLITDTTTGVEYLRDKDGGFVKLEKVPCEKAPK